jgi:hypothetical protein
MVELWRMTSPTKFRILINMLFLKKKNDLHAPSVHLLC